MSLEEVELEFMETNLNSMQARSSAGSPSLRVERSGLLSSLHLMGMATPWVPSLWQLLLWRDCVWVGGCVGVWKCD